jgi:integrase
MRRGEALPLRWDDLNPVTRRFIVRRQLVQGYTARCQWCGREHKVAWREPKTAAGVRVVELDRQTAEVLQGVTASPRTRNGPNGATPTPTTDWSLRARMACRFTPPSARTGFHRSSPKPRYR